MYQFPPPAVPIQRAMASNRFNLVALLLLFPALVSASEAAGTLTTGIQTGIEGTVIVVPTANPVAGVYTAAQNVTLVALGAQSIRYTTDGTAPSCSLGSVYTAAIAVSASQVIQALSCYPNAFASAVSVVGYAIKPPSGPAAGSSGSGGSGGGGGGGGGGSFLPSPVVMGDATGDAIVNILDFNAVLVAWGSTGPSILADLNRDGVVDIIDFNVLIINWTP